MESSRRLRRDDCLARQQEHLSAFNSSFACGQLPERTGGSKCASCTLRAIDERPSLSCHLVFWSATASGMTRTAAALHWHSSATHRCCNNYGDPQDVRGNPLKINKRMNATSHAIHGQFAQQTARCRKNITMLCCRVHLTFFRHKNTVCCKVMFT
jgi:hypothetical protein